MMNTQTITLLVAAALLCMCSSVWAQAQLANTAQNNNDVLVELDNDNAPPVCPTPDAMLGVSNDVDITHKKASVLVGVDLLGRILVAVDADGDGLADETMMFADDIRLTEPTPRFIRQANVYSSVHTLRIEALDKSFALSTAVGDFDAQKISGKGKRFNEIQIETNGIAFHRSGPPALVSSDMRSFDFDSASTWPEVYNYDVHFVGTGGGPDPCPNCSTNPCQTGGCNATSCSVPCSGSCSVSCSGDTFACCNCPGLCIARCLNCNGPAE